MVRRQTIVYTSLNDLSLYGGIETMIPQEVEHLSSLGYTVHVLSPKPSGPSRLKGISGVYEHHIPAAFRIFPWLLKDLLSIIWICSCIRRTKNESGLVSVSFSAMDGAGAALARLLGSDARVVLRIVGPLSYEVVHFAAKKKARYRIYSRLFMLIEAFSYLVADVLLPVSEFEKANIDRYGISPEKVRITRCGVDSLRFDGHRNTSPLTLPGVDGVVMFVGRLVEKNGPLVIANAVPRVLRSRPGCVFVFVGDGPLRDTLHSKLEREVSSGRVVFTGFREDIPDLHSQADIYVGHVSSLVDGLGQTVFEAMMSGLPVIAGNDSISTQIITDGIDGLLVPKDDPEALASAIVILLNDSQKRESMGRMARARALRGLSFNAMMADVVREF